MINHVFISFLGVKKCFTFPSTETSKNEKMTEASALGLSQNDYGPTVRIACNFTSDAITRCNILHRVVDATNKLLCVM